jgi:hypothetical protein
MSQAFDDKQSYCTGPTITLPASGTFALTVRPHVDQSVANILQIYGQLYRPSSGNDGFYCRNYTQQDIGIIVTIGGSATQMTAGWHSADSMFYGTGQKTSWPANGDWQHIILTWEDQGGGNRLIKSWFNGISTGSQTFSLPTLTGWAISVGNYSAGVPYGCQADVAQVCLDNVVWSSQQQTYYLEGVSPSTISTTLVEYWPMVGCDLSNSGTDTTALVASGSPHATTCTGPDPAIVIPIIGSAAIGPSGMTFVCIGDDSHGNLVGLPAPVNPATLTINGGSPITLNTWITEGVYSAWLLPQGTVVRASDTVTASIPANTWLSNIGPVSPFSGTVDNSLAPTTGSNVVTSSYLDPITLNPSAMKIGYNAPYIGGSVPLFADLTKGSAGSAGNYAGGGNGPNANPQVSGGCTSATSTTVTDTNSGFGTNALVGAPIFITSGAAAGQKSVVSSNTAHTITFSPSISPTPSAGDGYLVTRWTTDPSDGYPVFYAWSNVYEDVVYAGDGTYTLTWDSSDFGDLRIGVPGANSVTYVTGSNTGNLTGNSRTYHIAGGQNPLVLFSYSLHIDAIDSGRITEAGSWSTVTGSGYNNSYRKSTGTTSDVITVSLGTLPVGTYNVYAFPTISSSNTSNASYVVTQVGSGSPLSSVGLNLRVDNTSFNVFDNYAGAPARGALVGTFTPGSSGAVTLTITNVSGDGFLIGSGLLVLRNDTDTLPLSTGVKPVTNHAFYACSNSDGTITPGTTITHPTFARMIGGACSLRTMPLFRAVDSSIEHYGQFARVTDRTFGSVTDRLGSSDFPIRKITGWSNWGDPNNFYNSNYTYGTRGAGNGLSTVLFTLDAPHGWASGVPLVTTIPNNTILASDSSTGTMNAGSGCFEYDSTRMATNQIALGSYTAGTPISGTSITPASGLDYLIYGYAESIPPAYAAYLVNPVSGCDLYVSVPANATQSCVTSMATDIGNALASGRKILVGLANEPWNAFFPPWAYFYGMSNVARAKAAGNTSGTCTSAHGVVPSDGSASVAREYARAAILVHNWFRAALAALPGGDRSGDLLCLFESWMGSPPFTQDIVDVCVASSAPCDAITIARYEFTGLSDGSSMGPNVEACNIEQVLDFAELSVKHNIGNNESLTASHHAILAAAGSLSGHKQLIAYEWSFEKPALNGSGMPGGQSRRASLAFPPYPAYFNNSYFFAHDSVAALQSAAAMMHPRAVKIMEALAQHMSVHISRAHYYQFDQVPANEGDPDGDCHWYIANQFYNQPAGIGSSGEGNGGAYDPLPDLRGSSTLSGALPFSTLAVPLIPTINPTGGGTGGGSLAAGTRDLVVTETNGDGEQLASLRVTFTTTSGQIPRVTFGALNPGSTARSIYVTEPGAGTLHLYASAIITGTYDMNSASNPSGLNPPTSVTTSKFLQADRSRSVSYIAGAINAWNSATVGPATTYTMTLSPTTGPISTAMSVTVTPNGTVTGTISVAVSSGEGFTTPMSFVFTGGSAPITISNTPSSAGTATFTPSQSLSLTDPSAKTYVVTDPTHPAVTSVSPSTGTTAGGTTVVITGTTFSAATGVTFGGTTASFTIDSGTQITATSPAHSAGVTDIVVTNAAGSSSTSSADHFTYVAPSTFHSSGRHTVRSGGKQTILIGG